MKISFINDYLHKKIKYELIGGVKPHGYFKLIANEKVQTAKN